MCVLPSVRLGVRSGQFRVLVECGKWRLACSLHGHDVHLTAIRLCTKRALSNERINSLFPGHYILLYADTCRYMQISAPMDKHDLALRHS